MSNLPWFADYFNFVASKVLPSEFLSQQKKKSLHDVTYYYWDDPYLFGKCSDDIIRRCVPKKETFFCHCHTLDYGEHFGGQRTIMKVFQLGFY